MQPHSIVSQEEWIAARKAHLRNEKALTRMRDLVAAERRALPWVKVEKKYVFDTTAGKKELPRLDRWRRLVPNAAARPLPCAPPQAPATRLLLPQRPDRLTSTLGRLGPAAAKVARQKKLALSPLSC